MTFIQARWISLHVEGMGRGMGEEEEFDFLDNETGREEDEYEDAFSDDESTRVKYGYDQRGRTCINLSKV